MCEATQDLMLLAVSQSVVVVRLTNSVVRILSADTLLVYRHRPRAFKSVTGLYTEDIQVIDKRSHGTVVARQCE